MMRWSASPYFLNFSVSFRSTNTSFSKSIFPLSCLSIFLRVSILGLFIHSSLCKQRRRWTAVMWLLLLLIFKNSTISDRPELWWKQELQTVISTIVGSSSLCICICIQTTLAVAIAHHDVLPKAYLFLDHLPMVWMLEARSVLTLS